MKKKHLKELNKIKKIIIDALQEPQKIKFDDEKSKEYLLGDFVCHEDGVSQMDVDFTVCGEDTSVAYVVMIQKIDL